MTKTADMKAILEGCVTELQESRERQNGEWEALMSGLAAAHAIIDERPIGAYAIILAVSRDLEFHLMGDVDTTDPILKAIEEATDVYLEGLDDLIGMATSAALPEDESGEGES